jgi:hypothetical protein
MAKIVRLTEQDLIRLVNRILKEDVKVEPSKEEPSKEDSVDYMFERELREGNFKLRPNSDVRTIENYYSVKPSTKPNLSCTFACRNDNKYCNLENGFEITIIFNRKVQELNGFWSNKQAPGPLVELDKVMNHDYDLKGITTMTVQAISSNKAEAILRLYNEIKFQ